jgi:hypothetical protein
VVPITSDSALRRIGMIVLMNRCISRILRIFNNL